MAPVPLLLALAFGASGAETAGPVHLEFIHVDANVGSSSGGHTALKIGDSVYHFQNERGYIRLARDDWNRFRFVYNDLDNRNLNIARVRVRKAAVERVRDRFSVLFLVQNRHVDHLGALERDAELLRSLSQGEPFAMPGAGFFERRPHESPSSHELQAAIADHLGAAFLAAERKRLGRELAALTYRSASESEDSPAEDRYPRYQPTFSEGAENLYARALALAALEEEWPLRDGLLIEAEDGMPLSESERRWLRAYRSRLLDAILEGLESRGTEGDFPLLLAIARFAAISESLTTHRFLLLDGLSSSFGAERFVGVDKKRDPLLKIFEKLRMDFSRLRREVLADTEPDETAYHKLESHAAQIREIRRGLATNRPIHFLRRAAAPQGWGIVRLPLSPPTSEAVAAAESRARTFRERIEALYPYDLVRRNCVTELVRTMNAAFASRNEIESALGGQLEPGEDFIPYRFFERVRQRYPVESVTVLPSYRNRVLRQLTHRESAWAVHAVEASPWTSSFYEPRTGDTLFLLFTEEVFWTRPLYGALNLAYGLGGAAVGLLAAPFDRGQHFVEGLRGALFSLPELVFGNIRKGSFDGTRSLMDQSFEMPR